MEVIVDIEADNLILDVTTIYCIACKVDNNPTKVYTIRPIAGSDGPITEALSILSKADRIIGHNIIKYDLPAIKKVLGRDFFHPDKVFDTLLASQLVLPNIIEQDLNNSNLTGRYKGSHSLKAWGIRLGLHKGDFEDWSKLSAEMVEYNRQDVEVTTLLYNKLKDKVNSRTLNLENTFCNIIARQERYGVMFDINKAQQLHIELLKEKDIMDKKLSYTFTPLYLPDGNVKTQADYKKPFPTKTTLGMIYGDFQRIELVEFNPASRHHIVYWFKRWYGWEPTKLTDKGNPIVDEAVLDTLEYPEAKILSHYFNVNKLLGQLAEGDNAWMKQIRKDKNGLYRIHGNVNTIGAVTRRCTHTKPNMAQVPSPRAFKGKECRELFTVPKGKKLVGCDADGLELRTLSHYMARYDSGAYAKAVDEGKKENGTDIHTLNMKAAGLPDRDTAKTFIYAFLYGAGDAKIGTIVNGSDKEGKALKNKFFKQIPAIKQLITAVGEAVKKNGFVNSLDSHPYFIRSSHSALNTLLQGAGAIVMKYYLVLLDRNLEKVYTNSSTTTIPEYEFLLNIHDEVQIECNEDIAGDVASIAEATFNEVTELLNFRIPLRGSAAIGSNWYDTH